MLPIAKLFRVGCFLVGAVTLFGFTSKQQSSTHETALRLKREVQTYNLAASKFEANVQEKRSKYATAAERAAIDAIKDGGDCLLHPRECSGTPKLGDIYKSLDKSLADFFATLNDIVDLKTQAKELELKQIQISQDLKSLHLIQAAEIAKRRRRRSVDRIVLDATREAEKVVPEQLQETSAEEIDDLLGELCYAGKDGMGDRCFDGRPEALVAFLERHPEYMAKSTRKEAIYSTPERIPALPPKGTRHSYQECNACVDACDFKVTCVLQCPCSLL